MPDITLQLLCDAAAVEPTNVGREQLGMELETGDRVQICREGDADEELLGSMFSCRDAIFELESSCVAALFRLQYSTDAGQRGLMPELGDGHLQR